ncbi:hypothetical protein J132_06040 [Termitomyces sp. J132]|nr:hypothetical protein C0989_006789 [Termitomyces sp. Mn162]KAH0587767.1 hypothetical protein H2248_006524 [Termitomyces sp. 'cryptogamus']KNZ74819.1 hypothetical protein J132_06040 [Termitomyces sp. J132]
MLPPDRCPVQSFDDILDSSPLPPPGPDFYTARRALWLTPRPSISASPGPSASRQRLEQLLSAPNAAEGDYAWNHGVKKVWESLDAGGKLKKRLPLSLIIKIIYAAWLRNDTWPTGAVAPEPDDVLPNDYTSPELLPQIFLPWSSGATTPWMTTNTGDTEVHNGKSAVI